MTAFYYAFTLVLLLFAFSFAWKETKHCPYQWRMENGALCKDFHSTKGSRVFSECSFGDSYVNPYSFAPIEVCGND